MKKLSRSIFASFKRPSKKALVWTSIAAALLVIASYALWSQQTWAQYQPSYEQQRHDAKVAITKAVALPTATAEERATAMTAFADIVRRIDDSLQTMCDVSFMVRWQAAMIDSLAQRQADCRQLTDNMQDFKTQLQKVTDYLQNDQALAKLIAAVPQPDKLAADKWPAQVKAWQQAIQSTEDLSASDAFKSTQTLAIKQMTAVKTAWQDVIAAHKAKDKKQYLSAQSALAGAYDGLYKIATTSEKVASQLFTELQKSSVIVLKDNKH